MNRETFQAIRDLLMEKLDMSREMTDREILDEIDQLILNRMRDSYISPVSYTHLTLPTIA